MKPEQIFLGNLRRCTKYNIVSTFSSSMYIGNDCLGTDSFGYIEKEDVLHKENAVLIKLDKGGYLDLDDFNSILDYLRIHRCYSKDGGYRLGDIILSTSAYCKNSIFVDEQSLKPYFQNPNLETQNDINLLKLKRQIRGE